MEIALCFDNNFVMQAGVFIQSACMSNQANEITFFAISECFSDENKAILTDLVAHFQNKKIEFVEIDVATLNDFPVRKKDHISIAAYYRLLLPSILPQHLTKVLYFDCDMLVVDDLQPLYNLAIEDYSTAVVADMFYNDETITNRLLYNVTDHYYNSGMLLINLKYWREHSISRKLLAFITEHKDLCIAHDQDALNAVLHGTILTAPARYNIQLDFLKKEPSNMVIADKDVFDDALASGHNPCVIHFTGPSKPWKYQCFNPYGPLWDFFQGQTIWKNQPKTHEFKGWKLLKWKRHQLSERLNLRPKRVAQYIDVQPEIERIIRKLQ